MTLAARHPGALDSDPLAAGWAELAARGLLRGDAFGSRREELLAVREAAGTGLPLGRVFDGHRNGLERVLRHRPQDVAADLRAAIAGGELALGVWGAEPGPTDGPPAVLCHDGAALTLRGVKTFCSGAGLLDLAIVLVRRTPSGPPILPALIDLREPGTVEIDRAWFHGDALRESRSDRVVFHDAPVLALLGSEGTLSASPWISGDALRSTAVWAGGVDALMRRLGEHGAGRLDHPADLERLGHAAAIARTVDVWLEAGLREVERAEADPGHDPAPAIGALRLELTERIRELLRLTAELAGSRGLVHDERLLRARGGLDVLLLQHRLGPVAARLGRAVAERSG